MLELSPIALFWTLTWFISDGGNKSGFFRRKEKICSYSGFSRRAVWKGNIHSFFTWNSLLLIQYFIVLKMNIDRKGTRGLGGVPAPRGDRKRSSKSNSKRSWTWMESLPNHCVVMMSSPLWLIKVAQIQSRPEFTDHDTCSAKTIKQLNNHGFLG